MSTLMSDEALKPYHSNRADFVCKSKVKYGNLKSVARTMKILGEEYKTEFDYYECGNGKKKHYHLTHKNPAERIGKGNQFNKAERTRNENGGKV